ncbi:MAG: sulfatase-like hydrolase/transferase [Planctomycetota bacterium]
MPKNIVWICTDQQRADSLGCMGNPHAHTPRLDALAESGTLLNRLISPHPVCMPSRASMLSGCVPLRHGVVTNGVALGRRGPDDHALRSHVPTMADHLADHGYHTRCIGKLHLEPHQPPRDAGFRESYAAWAAGDNDGWFGPHFGFEHCELTENHAAQPGGAYIRWMREHRPEAAAALEDQNGWPARPCALGDLQPVPIEEELFSTMWLAERAAAFFESDEARERPFFCWLGILDPHHPWQIPQTLADRFGDAAFLEPTRDAKQNPVSIWAGDSFKDNRLDRLDDPDLCEAMVRRYTDAQNALIDRAVGRVIDSLEATNLWDDTVLLFTSDHGDFLGDYGLIRKTNVSCVSLNHVPGVMHDPGGSLPSTVHRVCSGLDLGPTLCHAAGVPWATHDGHALQDGATGEAFVQCAHGQSESGPPSFSIWTDHERYSWYPTTGEAEYHDHRVDPHEIHNAADAQPDRCVELKSRLLEHVAETASPNAARVSGW